MNILNILQCIVFVAMAICYFMQAKDHKEEGKKVMMYIDISVGVFALLTVALYIILLGIVAPLLG